MHTHAATRLLALIFSLRYIARIQTSLNSCDRSQRQNSVPVTVFSHVTRGDLLQQPVAATCRSDLSHRVSRPLCDIGRECCHQFVSERGFMRDAPTSLPSRKVSDESLGRYCLCRFWESLIAVIFRRFSRERPSTLCQTTRRSWKRFYGRYSYFSFPTGGFGFVYYSLAPYWMACSCWSCLLCNNYRLHHRRLASD